MTTKPTMLFVCGFLFLACSRNPVQSSCPALIAQHTYDRIEGDSDGTIDTLLRTTLFDDVGNVRSTDMYTKKSLLEYYAVESYFPAYDSCFVDTAYTPIDTLTESIIDSIGIAVATLTVIGQTRRVTVSMPDTVVFETHYRITEIDNPDSMWVYRTFPVDVTHGNIDTIVGWWIITGRQVYCWEDGLPVSAWSALSNGGVELQNVLLHDFAYDDCGNVVSDSGSNHWYIIENEYESE